MDKDYVIALVEFAKKELLPRHKHVYIDIVIDPGMEFLGLCTEEDWRDFTLAVNPNQSLEEIERTVFHEMVHVKQYVRGELKEKFNPVHRRFWKGELVPEEVAYLELPWEAEAFEMQEILWERWNKA